MHIMNRIKLVNESKDLGAHAALGSTLEKPCSYFIKSTLLPQGLFFWIYCCHSPVSREASSSRFSHWTQTTFGLCFAGGCSLADCWDSSACTSLASGSGYLSPRLLVSLCSPAVWKLILPKALKHWAQLNMGKLNRLLNDQNCKAKWNWACDRCDTPWFMS